MFDRPFGRVDLRVRLTSFRERNIGFVWFFRVRKQPTDCWPFQAQRLARCIQPSVSTKLSKSSTLTADDLRIVKTVSDPFGERGGVQTFEQIEVQGTIQKALPAGSTCLLASRTSA